MRNEEVLALPGDPILSYDGTAILARFKVKCSIPVGGLLTITRYPRMAFHAAAPHPHEIETCAISLAFNSRVIRVYRVDRDLNIRSDEDWSSWFRGSLFARGDALTDDDRLAEAINLVLGDRTVSNLVCVGGIDAPDRLKSFADYLRQRA